jgi:anti-sigma regulatory factor (Ser/Thr protein kinase)
VTATPDLELKLPARAENVAVVRHAFGGFAEVLTVDASFDDERLTVVIRDSGRGIVPRPDSPGLGLGLPLIATLAESLELGTDDGDHTEVRMTFRLDEVAA